MAHKRIALGPSRHTLHTAGNANINDSNLKIVLAPRPQASSASSVTIHQPVAPSLITNLEQSTSPVWSLRKLLCASWCDFMAGLDAGGDAGDSLQATAALPQ